MLRRFLIKFGQGLLTVFLASIVVFLAIRALPGDPAETMAGEDQNPAVIAAIRARLGLDKPMPEQYLLYMWHALHGDFGTSISSRVPVSTLLGQTLPVTLQLTVLTMVCGGIVGMLMGSVGAYWRGQWPEWLSSVLSLVGLSVPHFWLAMLAIIYVGTTMRLFPVSGYTPLHESLGGNIGHLIVPALILGSALAAVLMRQTRANMLDAFGAEYILAVRAKGASESRVVIGHALRNSLVVAVTILGLELGGLLSGAAVIEQIFGLPGIGRLAINAVFSRDYPVVQGVVLVVAVSYVAISLLLDVLYTVLDPRIRVGG